MCAIAISGLPTTVLADYDGAIELERGLDILLKGLSGILTPQTA
jgi:hypothetical protein